MLNRITQAREAEKLARTRFLQRWAAVESVPYRLVTARAIREALEQGATKKDVLGALETTNYNTVNDYLKMVSEIVEEQEENGHAPRVRITTDGATVGPYSYVRDGEGNWEPEETESDEAWSLLQHLPQ